jgi:hypothetical protein
MTSRRALRDRIDRPLQTRSRGLRGPGPTPRAAGRRNPVRRASEVEEVRALRLVELKRARDRVEHGRGGTRDRSALEFAVVLDAHIREDRDLGAAEPRHATIAAAGKARLFGRQPRATRHEELAHL